MADFNELRSSLEADDGEIKTQNFDSSSNQLNSQTVYLTYNNQYNIDQTPSNSYVLPVAIINNESDFIYYNNALDHHDIDQSGHKDPVVPQYIVNLDGTTKPNITSTSNGINTITVQNVDRLHEMYSRFPLLNKLMVKRIYTRNLLSIDKAIYELDILHKVEETKRKNIVLVCKKPKQEIIPIFRTKGDNNLKSLVLTKKPFERMSSSLYKKVTIQNNNVYDCEKEVDGSIVEDFIKSRCKAFVSDEVNGVIQEDPKGVATKSEQTAFKTKTEKITAGPEAGSIYPWRNNFDNEKLSDNDDNTADISNYDLDICLPSNHDIKDSFVINQSGFLSDLCISDKLTHEVEKEIPKLEFDEPKFFRTKRLGDMEMKKKTYVSNELHQLRADKRILLNSTRNCDSPIRKKRKNMEDSEESVKNEALESLSDSHNRLSITPIFKNKYKNALTNEEKAAFIHFFNGASISELSLMPGCSIKKSEVIISLRPFTSMKDLNTKIKDSNILSDNILESCQEVINMRNMLSKLLQKCEKIASHIDKIMWNHLDSNKLELPHQKENENPLICKVPLCMNPKLELKSYQLVGLNWLYLLHKEKLNGILADEMGLGKTVQTISFLAYLYDLGEKGPHLIIVPSSTISTWERELNVWCPQLQVIVYHGSQDERKQMRMKIYEGKTLEFNVLLTTYNISIGTMEDRAMMKRVNFHYGVFDEAHMLKNMLSNRYKNLINFKVKRRLLLTGTPLQNNLLELISLLSFVMPDLFLPHTDFLKKIFQTNVPRKDDQTGNNILMSEFDCQKISQTKDLLKPFCLRRSKEQVLSQLPIKQTEFIYLPLIESQKRIYDHIISDMRQNIDNDVKTSQTHLSLVMNLRKVSNHSLLMRNLYTHEKLRLISLDLLQDKSHESANPETIYEDLLNMNDFQIHITCQLYNHVIGKYQLDDKLLVEANKFLYLDQHVPLMIKNGHKILIFSQFVMMLDVLEAYINLNKYPYLRLDGQTPVCDRQELIDKFNEDETIKIFLLSKRAGGLGINLTGADIVIIYDIDFNPFNDRQAEDRCHRLGQTKNVRVIKLISKDTIEEEILSIANDKLKLDASTSSGLEKNCEEDNVDLDDDIVVSNGKVKGKRVKFQTSDFDEELRKNVNDSVDLDDASITDIELLISNALV